MPRATRFVSIRAIAPSPGFFSADAILLLFGQEAAGAAGATGSEIKEAVGQAALTRHWLTILNGLRIDFDHFKAKMGG